MHIAICMDIAADRKQLERLLGRSADRRLAIDNSFPFYIQSYGNKEAILKRASMYDLFFIELIFDTMNSVELIRELRRIGVSSTIVLCPGKEDRTGELTPEDNVLILRQPIKVEELDEVMDQAIAEVKSRVPMIELRTITETCKVLPEEIHYIERSKSGVVIHMADGTCLESKETLKNMWERVEAYDKLYYLPENIITNIDYVKNISFGRVILKDGKKIRANRLWLKYLQNHLMK